MREGAVEKMIEKIGQYFISFFAMTITLISFLLLSLQILFISIIWMITSFLSRLSYKLSHYGIER